MKSFELSGSASLDGKEPSDLLISLKNVSKRFRSHQQGTHSFQEKFVNLFQKNELVDDGFFWSLHDVSFDVYEGDSIGLIGPNGSGKSTLLKLISGIIEPTSGNASVNGRISSLLELGAGFHPDLTGRENIYLNGSIYGLNRQQIHKRIDEIIEFSELEEFIDMPIKHYSSGMYVRLGFAVAIHTEPDILLIDEVLAVGDAAFQHKCMSNIHRFRANGGTLILVSHDLGSIQSLCNRAVWFDHGEIQEMGHPTDVVMSYLNRVAEDEVAREEKKRDAEEEEHTEIKDGEWRRGTHDLEITDVELCDQHGRRRSVFTTGSSVEIRLHYHAKTEIKHPVFGLGLHRQDNTHICGPNTKFGNLHITSIKGKGTISYQIPDLALLAGTYLISVAAVDSTDAVTYDYHDRAYTFRVYPGNTQEQYGFVTLRGKWEFAPTDETINGEIANNKNS